MPARLLHAPPQTDPNTSWIWLYFVSSSLLRRQWGVTSPAKKKKKHKQSLGSSPFSNMFLFLFSLFLPVWFFFLSSRFLRWQIRRLCLGGSGRGGGQIYQCLKVSAWRRRKCFLGAGSSCGSVGTTVCWLLLEAGCRRWRKVLHGTAVCGLLAHCQGRRCCCCHLFGWLRCGEESSCWVGRLREEGDDGEVRERPVSGLFREEGKWLWEGGLRLAREKENVRWSGEKEMLRGEKGEWFSSCVVLAEN